MRTLFGFWTDAILLGGGSVVALAVVEIANLSNAQMVILGGAMLFMANFVNHPHFAHSYQLFYGLRKSLTSNSHSEKYFRRRWLWAAFVAPAIIFAILAFSIFSWSQGHGVWLALCINLMSALVGWHYVKQGFGMVMLDASMKESYWSKKTRRALLFNAYACWLTAWLLINSYSTLGGELWGLFRLPVTVPAELVLVACLVVAVTTAWMGLAVLGDISIRRSKGTRWSDLPLNGLMAYLVTLYLWTLFSWVNTAFMLIIPFFHSLQYLTLVYRHALNERHVNAAFEVVRVVRFFVIGLVLGCAGFWILPIAIEYFSTGKILFYSKGIFVGVASIWVFINIHHYLIDNVLWRKESAHINFQLFAHLEVRSSTSGKVSGVT